MPLTVDGLIYASSMVMLDSARRKVPIPALSRWLLGVGIEVTLAANLAHGLGRGPAGAVVASWQRGEPFRLPQGAIETAVGNATRSARRAACLFSGTKDGMMIKAAQAVRAAASVESRELFDSAIRRRIRQNLATIEGFLPMAY